MTKKEKVLEVLQRLGYFPQTDEDGDVMFRYQIKTLFVMNTNEDDAYLSLIFPQFYEIEEGEDALVLAACNKLTREIKMAKVFIDHTYRNVSASCEFFFTDKKSLEQSLNEGMRILGMIRSTFRQAKMDLSA